MRKLCLAEYDVMEKDKILSLSYEDVLEWKMLFLKFDWNCTAYVIFYFSQFGNTQLCRLRSLMLAMGSEVAWLPACKYAFALYFSSGLKRRQWWGWGYGGI